jgi:uncharacterized surface protein with fasciclin (FAS1) repeats
MRFFLFVCWRYLTATFCFLLLSLSPISDNRGCAYAQAGVSQVAANSSAGTEKKQTKPQTLIFMLEKSGVFQVFLSAIRQAGFEDKLNKEGPFTVLAPRDAAFTHVNSISREKLFSSKSNLKSFIEQHILIGTLTSADFSALDSVLSLGGQALSVEHKEQLEIGRAKVIRADIQAENGTLFMLGQAILIDK